MFVNKRINYFFIVLGAAALILFATTLHKESFANSPPTLVINNQTIDYSPGPQIIEGRTLVPIRVISETLGADVVWDEQERTVSVKKEGRSVLLHIESHLVNYKEEGFDYDVIDVPPKIIESRTFVPLRLISNVLGADINWDGRTRTVEIESADRELSSFSDLSITSPWKNQTVVGKTSLKISDGGSLPAQAAEIRYLLLDPSTRKGVVIARGTDIKSAYEWLPETSLNGSHLLVAAVYNANGQVIAGDAINLTISVNPKAEIKGITNNQVFSQLPVTVQAGLSFSPKYVTYEFTNLDTKKTTQSREADPFGTYNWRPMADDNGRFSVTVTATDHDNKTYTSPEVYFELTLERNLALGGVRSGQAITGPVSLSATRNFEVSQTQYWKRNTATDEATMISQTGFGAHQWFPGPQEQGSYELYVRVLDTRLRPYTSDPVPVTVSGTPQLRIRGVGPDQVITGEITMTAQSNVPLQQVQFELLNPSDGSRKTIASGDAVDESFAWTPSSNDAGNRVIRVIGQRSGGNSLTSQEIPVTIYLGQLHSAKAIIEREKFKDFASELALESASKTGMSASLQTAQAILETGWGQSLPVDKYSGKFSRNLFGIKGSGPAGSVLSNTWEEYNGVAFRTDAHFRAYHNVNQSWDDHKNLLLLAARYEPFRAVMHDSSQGAWALRRSGYATDSLYPIKLMDIIRLYDLKKLDEVDF